MMVSGEKGIHIIIACCAKTNEHFVSPIFIFKRKCQVSQLGPTAPPESLVEVAAHGFITSELFINRRFT